MGRRTGDMNEDVRGVPAGRLDELRRQMVRLAVRFVWNRDDAEELVQEAFKIAAAGGPGTGEEKFNPWMVRTVTNLCLNHRRKRKPEPLLEWMEAATDGGPAEAMEQTEQLERLRDSIEQLPPQQRAALVMRTMQQMSYDEIAEAMELSASAVRAHVHLARQRLAGWMGEP